jgi:hypothetical protein
MSETMGTAQSACPGVDEPRSADLDVVGKVKAWVLGPSGMIGPVILDCSVFPHPRLFLSV